MDYRINGGLAKVWAQLCLGGLVGQSQGQRCHPCRIKKTRELTLYSF